jgi:hypothetical protein
MSMKLSIYTEWARRFSAPDFDMYKNSELAGGGLLSLFHYTPILNIYEREFNR